MEVGLQTQLIPKRLDNRPIEREKEDVEKKLDYSIGNNRGAA